MQDFMRELHETGATATFGNAIPAVRELEQLVGAEAGSQLAKRYKVV